MFSFYRVHLLYRSDSKLLPVDAGTPGYDTVQSVGCVFLLSGAEFCYVIDHNASTKKTNKTVGNKSNQKGNQSNDLFYL